MGFPRDLRCFCQHVTNKYGSPDAASEDEKADEFREAYFGRLPINADTLKALSSEFNIRLHPMDRIPKNLRGFHQDFDGHGPEIYYKRDDCESGLQNTFLHELREIIEPVFSDVCPEYVPLRTSAVHVAANKFASAVLLPRDSFRDQAYRTGFDTIQMADLYSKSCAQVLLRIGEVLQDSLFFYGALYENGAEGNPDWQVTYWTRRMNLEFPDANPRVSSRFFPRKGHAVAPHSLVELAIISGRPHLADRISLTEDIDEYGLVAIAQPLVRAGKVIKVALIVMMESDRRKLKPQIGRTKPIAINHFHRHL